MGVTRLDSPLEKRFQLGRRCSNNWHEQTLIISAIEHRYVPSSSKGNAIVGRHVLTGKQVPSIGMDELSMSSLIVDMKCQPTTTQWQNRTFKTDIMDEMTP
jgi:hypothetical protein